MLNHLTNLPEPKRQLLEHLVDKLKRVDGMAAIVLGGSYASGTQHAHSDLDLGLYYTEAKPFEIAEIRRIAEEVSVAGSAAVTGFYEWGAWVNGGAWIQTPHGKVDFLYRNLEQVQRTLAEAQAGIARHDYNQQPTFGFYSVIYLAETQICIPLHDPDLVIVQLKRGVETYLPQLKATILKEALWAAEFTLSHARGFAAQGDLYNTVGCLTRVLAELTQALFALNERYFIRYKQVTEVLAGFPNLPAGYIPQINQILACPGRTAEELTQTVSALEQVWKSVVELPGVNYEPKFQI